MKKIIKLTESDLTRLVKTIVETITTEDIPQEELDKIKASVEAQFKANIKKAEEVKLELDRMKERFETLDEKYKNDEGIMQYIKDILKQKENEYNWLTRDSREHYMQNMILDYKREQAYKEYEREKIERRKTKKITKEDIINLFVTALEGGSNYWYYLSEIPSGVRDIKMETGMSTSEAIGEYVLRGGSIQVNDAEDEEEVLGTVDMDSLLEAISKIKEDYPHVYENIIDEEYDAEDADIFFQIATMGEITFG